MAWRELKRRIRTRWSKFKESTGITLHAHTWQLVHSTGKYKYYECNQCMKRKLVEVTSGGYQPINREWLDTKIPQIEFGSILEFITFLVNDFKPVYKELPTSFTNAGEIEGAETLSLENRNLMSLLCKKLLQINKEEASKLFETFDSEYMKSFWVMYLWRDTAIMLHRLNLHGDRKVIIEFAEGFKTGDIQPLDADLVSNMCEQINLLTSS